MWPFRGEDLKVEQLAVDETLYLLIVHSESPEGIHKVLIWISLDLFTYDGPVSLLSNAAKEFQI